ncbi:MAG TPA: glycosyltransferase [Thermomicrobiaceae bacterium]|nr:glycosyltransferase [Thermomicrobiaceae bacterium]
MSRQPRDVLYLGTYERDYPRNVLVIAALRRAGFDVREIHAPVWERRRDKVAGLRSIVPWLRLGAALAVGYATLGARALLTVRSADVVFVGYPGQLDMVILAPLVRLLHRPVIFNPLVTLTDTLVEDRQLVASGSLPGRAIAALDRAALSLADAVIVDTPENGRYLVERYPSLSDSIYPLDVGADDRLFVPESPCERTPGGPLRVLFYGKFIPLHGVETILRAAARLDPDRVSFTLIGSGQTGHAARLLARVLGLTNVEFVDWVPFHDLPGHISRADVVLGIFGDTAKAARVVPNKVFQAMAMAAAIVTADTPAVRRVLQHGQSAMLVPAGDPEALADAIQRLTDPDLRRALGLAARAGFNEVGSIDALAGHLGKIIDAVTSMPAQPEHAWTPR